jgi:predicted permease
MRFRRRADSDFQAEIESHIAIETDRLVAQGMPRDEAYASARRTFGNVTGARERYFETSRLVLWEQLRQDLRYAFRAMRNAPGFTFAAVLTIALGIGANTAIFSLVDAVLLRMLPVDRPEQLVFLANAGTEGPSGSPPYPCFERFQKEASSFSGIAAFAGDQLKVQVDGATEQVMGQVASGSYFEVLGVRPALGRLMIQADERLDPPVAVIGYAFWQRRFGGDERAIGRTVGFRDKVFTIIGVTPEEFKGLQPGGRIDVTFPITIEREMLGNSGSWWFDTVARLKPGVPAAQARAETNAIFQSFMADRTSVSAEIRKKHFDHMELPAASRGTNSLRRRFSKPLVVLTGVAGFVLLIACANIGTLLLARGASRDREFAIRLATGAASGRLLRQLLAETLLLFTAGAAAGMAAGWVAVQGLTSLFAIGRNPIMLDVQYDWRLIAFTAGLTLATAVSSGLLPALRAIRSDPQAAMKEGEARATMSRRSKAAGRVFIVSQVALSLVLLAGAVAFLRSLVNLRHVDLGFTQSRVLTMSIQPDETLVPSTARTQFWMRVLDRVRSLPGVHSASLAVLTPLSGRDRGARVQVPGFQPRSDMDSLIRLNHVSEDYFETFGIGVVRGRTFTSKDSAGAPNGVILNEAAVRFYFRDRDPLGQTMQFSATPLSKGLYQVIGIVRDTKHMNLREAAPRFAFISMRQPRDGFGRVTVAAVSSLPEAQLAATIAREMTSISQGVLVSDVVTVQEQIDSTLLSERLVSILCGAFAALGLILSAVGMYGVISYGVARRTAEIGVRIALGAQPVNVAWDVVRQTAALLAIGLAIGVAGAVLATRAAESLLFGIKSADPIIYLTGALILAVVACAASYFPARRAAAVDPIQALRHG